jgi:hypothetical protein
MGKFSIGKFVLDGDDDRGEIIGKDGNFRTVKYPGGDAVRWHKRWLRPADDAAEVCPEKGKSEYSGASKGTWVPKVGDRVRGKQLGEDYNVEAVNSGGTIDVSCISRVTGETLHYPGNRIELFEPIDPPLTITVGKSYRTRDGRKVGPMEDRTGYFAADGYHYNASGLCGYDGVVQGPRPQWRVDRDVVAEWVEATLFIGDEPVAEVTSIAVCAPKFKVGDRVREIGYPEATGVVETVRKNEIEIKWDVGAWGWWPPDDFELVTPTPPIGSTVTFTATGRLSAINENGHYQVTFPGLAPAQNSFALPAQYVTPAN